METENILEMLLGQMNDQQQLRFKQAIIAQTSHYVAQGWSGTQSLLALANEAETGYQATIYALQAAGEFQQAEAKQWQKAAAWDILADRDPPPIEEFDD